MDTVEAEQAGPSLTIAEQDEVLAQQAHLLRQRAELGIDTHHQPVAPQPFAPRGAGCYAGTVRQTHALRICHTYVSARFAAAPPRPVPRRFAARRRPGTLPS
jgi:hypothetical protein